MNASAAYSPGLVPKVISNPRHPLIAWGKQNDFPTITALAKHLGVSHPRLSQILTRKHRPTSELALKIHSVTKIPIEHILGLSPEEERAGVKAGWEKKPKRAKRR